jgi:hypothetical protein
MTIGRSGQWIGLENFDYLFGDKLFWQAAFFSVFYTAIATVGKFGLGLWLALLLNNRRRCSSSLSRFAAKPIASKKALQRAVLAPTSEARLECARIAVGFKLSKRRPRGEAVQNAGDDESIVGARSTASGSREDSFDPAPVSVAQMPGVTPSHEHDPPRHRR